MKNQIHQVLRRHLLFCIGTYIHFFRSNFERLRIQSRILLNRQVIQNDIVTQLNYCVTFLNVYRQSELRILLICCKKSEYLRGYEALIVFVLQFIYVPTILCRTIDINISIYNQWQNVIKIVNSTKDVRQLYYSTTVNIKQY